jgi:Cellulase (glycosyl hydrolase family 5)
VPNPTPLPTRALPRARVAALLTLLAALLALATAASAGAANHPLYGVQASLATNDSQATLDRALDDAKAVHAKTIRLEVLWSQLEPKAAGQRDPDVVAATDHFIEGAARRGIKTLLLVDSTPCWASSSPKAGGCTAADPNTPDVTRYQPTAAGMAAYADVAKYLVQRYSADLSAFEVWNEPDQANELYWAGPDKVANYVKLAKLTYPVVKAAAPRVPVLAGSFVGGNGAWLKAMYAAGIKGSYDALSVHFYDLPLSALAATRAIQKANRDNKPLWLAEFGYTSCFAKGGKAFMIDHACNTRAGQAQNLVDVLRSIQRVSWVKAAVVYSLYDQTAAYQFGLWTAGHKVKPAFAKVKAVFSGKKVKVTKPSMKVVTRKGKVVVSGHASQTESYTLKVWNHGHLVYRVSFLRVDRFGAYKLTLPKVIGTTGLKLRLSGPWTGSVTRRH